MLVGDGSRGLPERAPFDAIAVHADRAGAAAHACSASSPTAAGWSSRSPPTSADMLTVFRREGDELRSEEIGPCRFVPLIGEEGFAGLAD